MTYKAMDQYLPKKNYKNLQYIHQNLLDCNDESFFNHNIKLTEEQKYLCEGNITFKECAQSLKLMTNGKSSEKYCEHFSPFSCQFAFDRRSIPSTFSSLFLSNSIFLLFKDDCINSLGAEFAILTQHYF
jgi:hypothetical protein